MGTFYLEAFCLRAFGLGVSGVTDEMRPHEIFIGFSTPDQEKAKLICWHLERADLRCWISLRDVAPGQNYQASIVKAIETTEIMVLVFSADSNRSPEVHKELSLASTFRVNVLPVRIENTRPDGALMYELATRQWIDAFEDWEPAMRRLVATARNLIAPERLARPHAPESGPMGAPPSLLVTNPGEGAGAPAAPPFSREDLEVARAALAQDLGPIADMLVRKVAPRATSLTDLHDRLAAHLPSEPERAEFKRRLLSPAFAQAGPSRRFR